MSCLGLVGQGSTYRAMNRMSCLGLVGQGSEFFLFYGFFWHLFECGGATFFA